MRKLIYIFILLFVTVIVKGQPEAAWFFNNSPSDTMGNYDVELLNGATYSTVRKEGTHSLSVDGGANRVAKTTSKVDLSTTNGLTINYWFLTYNSISTARAVMSNRSGNDGFTVYMDEVNKSVFVTTYNGSSGGSAISATGSWSTSTWNMATLIWPDITEPYCRIYVNSVRGANHDSITITGGFEVNDTLFLGNVKARDGSMYGRLDNIQIYLSALNGTQIDSLYASGATSFTVTTGSGSTPSSYYAYLLNGIRHKINATSGYYYVDLSGETPDEPEDTTFNIYMQWDFESLALEQQLPSNYFGSSIMHYNLDKTSIVYDAELEKKVVQIAAYPGLFGANAVELFADISSYGDFTELYYTFDWKFDKDFRNTWGGKMPGLSGVGAGVINASMTGGADANEGWKYRIMFGNAGYQSLYGYDHTSAYSYPWNTHQYPTVATPERTMDRFMNYGNWYSVTIRVVLNTCAACNNGYAEVWVDDRKVLHQTNLRQWSVSNIGNYIDVMSVNHFYGGSTSEYDPEVICYSYYANPRIWIPETPQIGLYDYSHLLSVPGQLEPSVFEHDVLITTEGTLQNTEYGDFYTSMKDETWLIDAGEGNTVTLSYSSGLGINDFFLVFDGNKTDAENIYMHSGSVTANTNGSVTSSGRYMFVRFATDKSGFSTGINCSVSFNVD